MTLAESLQEAIRIKKLDPTPLYLAKWGIFHVTVSQGARDCRGTAELAEFIRTKMLATVEKYKGNK